MCLAVPGKVLSISEPTAPGEARTAKVDFQGSRMTACLTLVPEAHEGDWVLVHAGYAIQTLDEEDALETWKYLEAAGVDKIQVQSGDGEEGSVGPPSA